MMDIITKPELVAFRDVEPCTLICCSHSGIYAKISNNICSKKGDFEIRMFSAVQAWKLLCAAYLKVHI